MTLKFQPAISVASFTKSPMFLHWASSHCRKTIVLPFSGAALSGSVRGIFVAVARYGLMNASASVTAEPESPALEPSESESDELLHAASSDARTTLDAASAKARRRRCPVVV